MGKHVPTRYNGKRKKKLHGFKKGDPRHKEIAKRMREINEAWKKEVEKNPELKEKMKAKPAKWKRDDDCESSNVNDGKFVVKQLRSNPKKKCLEDEMDDEVNFDDIYEDDSNDGPRKDEVLDVQSSIWPGRALEKLYELRQQGKMCDVFIQGSDGLMLVGNSHVLKAASSVLNKKLSEEPGMIHMRNITSVTWEHLLRFIYTGEVMASPEEQGPLLEAAQYLGVTGLVMATVEEEDLPHTGFKAKEFAGNWRHIESDPQWQPVVRLQRAEDTLLSLSVAHTTSSAVFMQKSANTNANTYIPPDIPSPPESPEPLETPESLEPQEIPPIDIQPGGSASRVLQGLAKLAAPQPASESSVTSAPPPTAMLTVGPNGQPYLKLVSTPPQGNDSEPLKSATLSLTPQPKLISLLNPKQPASLQSVLSSDQFQTLEKVSFVTQDYLSGQLKPEKEEKLKSAKELLMDKVTEQQWIDKSFVGTTVTKMATEDLKMHLETLTDVQVDPKVKKWFKDEEFSSDDEEDDDDLVGICDEHQLHEVFASRFERIMKEKPEEFMQDFKNVEPPEDSQDGTKWKCMVKVPKRQQKVYAIHKGKLVYTEVPKAELSLFGHAGGLAEAVFAVAELGKVKTKESMVNLKLGTPEETAKLKAMQPSVKAKPHIKMLTIPETKMKQTVFKCVLCRKRFLTKADALQHQNMKVKCKMEDAEQDIYQCESCHEVFFFRSMYVNHIRHSTCQLKLQVKLKAVELNSMIINRKIAAPAYWCTRCYRFFPDHHRMLRHINRKIVCQRYETAVSNYKKYGQDVPCLTCHKTFKSQYGYDLHLKKCEALPEECVDRNEIFFPKVFLCCICDFSHETKTSVQQHAKKEHPDEYEMAAGCYDGRKISGFRCQICHEVYRQGTLHNEHIWQMHGSKIDPNGRYFKCPICDFRTIVVNKMKAHLEKHDETRSDENVCKRCGRSFTSWEEYQNHMEKAHVNYMCSYCGKSYPKLQKLSDHLPLHTGKNPYECTLCDQSFPYFQSANNHIMKVHSVHKNECKEFRKYVRHPENEVQAITNKWSRKTVKKEVLMPEAQVKVVRDEYCSDSDAEDEALSREIDQALESISEEVVTNVPVSSQESLIHRNEGSKMIQAQSLPQASHQGHVGEQDAGYRSVEVQSTTSYVSKQEPNVAYATTSQVQNVGDSSQVQSVACESPQVLSRFIQEQSVDENGIQLNIRDGSGKDQPVRMIVGADGTRYLEIAQSTMGYLDSNQKHVVFN